MSSFLGSKSKPSKKPEDRDDMFLRNIGFFQRITRRCIPEDIALHINPCENLKSYMLWSITRKCTMGAFPHVALKVTVNSRSNDDTRKWDSVMVFCRCLVQTVGGVPAVLTVFFAIVLSPSSKCVDSRPRLLHILCSSLCISHRIIWRSRYWQYRRISPSTTEYIYSFVYAVGRASVQKRRSKYSSPRAVVCIFILWRFHDPLGLLSGLYL
jgi:hypothetical protein